MLRDNGTIWGLFGLEEAKDFLVQEELGAGHPSRLFVKKWIQKAYAGKKEKPSLLDVPCGSGVDYPVLKDICDYTGMDKTPILVDAIKDNFPDVVAFGGDIRDIKLEENSFDIVNARAIFEHLCDLDDAELAMKECYRVAKKYCIFSFFIPLGSKTEIIWSSGKYFNNKYGKEDISAILEKLGAKNIEYVHVPSGDYQDSYDVFFIEKK